MSESFLSAPNLSAEDVLAWNDRSAQSWRTVIEQHPEILAIPCDIYGVPNVALLLRHIVSAEVRYAQRLVGLPGSPLEAFLHSSAADLFDAHDRAIRSLRAELGRPLNWDEPFAFQTISHGGARSTRKTIFFHALLHSIRHYAQLATLVRQHGFQPPDALDYLFMNYEPIA